MIEPMGPGRKGTGAVLTAVLVATVAGCGGGERTFDAAELAEELNGAGAELVLGPVLTTNPDGLDVISVFVADPASEGDLGAGTMVLLDDADVARAEFARCETTASLFCYRAANGVLRFEELLPAGQAQLEAALAGIETVE